MPRYMSFMLTTEQIRSQSKTMTRRIGWWFLKPGDRVIAVEKAMGLLRGERVRKICEIEIVSTRAEPLDRIDQADVIREGFPQMTPAEFVEMFCRHMRCEPTQKVNRIEFKYIGGLS